MANSPHTELEFDGGCPDCARRVVMDLPQPLPDIGNDFDWQTRDYDSFRLFMMEELAARSPDRARWNPADLEVVLVEVLATALDQLSDMADRVTAEASLETARRPESVRRLLEFIGYDPVINALADGVIKGRLEEGRAVLVQRLEQAWREQPRLMEQPRRAGPREVHAPRRMVTVEDYGALMEEHPLVLRAHAFERWSGAWPQVRIAVVCWNERLLDDPGQIPPPAVLQELKDFEQRRGLPTTEWRTGAPTFRSVLTSYVNHLRMACQDVQLADAQPVGIILSVHVHVSPHYFQSEVRPVVEEVLGRGPRGFFAPGRLRFGEDVRASDIVQALTALAGVERVELRRFKRVGTQYLDQTASGRIILEGLELAVCDNLPGKPQRGSLDLLLSGGRRG